MTFARVNASLLLLLTICILFISSDALMANFTVENLRDFSGNLLAAKRINVTNLLVPGDLQGRIDKIVIKVNTTADDLDRRATDNSKNIRDV